MPTPVFLWEKHKMMKQDYRLHNGTYDIDGECDDIQDDVTLNKKLRVLFSDGGKSIVPHPHKIYPFCNEKLKKVGGVPSAIIGFFDKVNKPKINKPARDALSEVFGVSFTKTAGITEDPGFSHDPEAWRSPPPNPELFLETILMMAGENKDQFIASHSGFMTKLYNYITQNYTEASEIPTPMLFTSTPKHISTPSTSTPSTSTPSTSTSGKLVQSGGTNRGIFDNLDILQLILDTSKTGREAVKGIIVRRFSKNYSSVASEGEKPPPAVHYGWGKKNIRSVFIIRHCIGCHNLTPGKSAKIYQAAMEAAMHKKKGYLKWAMCVSQTYNEFMSQKENLLSILKEYSKKGTTKENRFGYTFGSSVIFRAILTSILAYNTMFGEGVASPLTSTEPSSLDDGRGKRKGVKKTCKKKCRKTCSKHKKKIKREKCNKTCKKKCYKTCKKKCRKTCSKHKNKRKRDKCKKNCSKKC
jgi:hypothetical protein